MIKREDFNGKTYDEMLAAMEADIVLYSDKLANFTTLDECLAEEQELMLTMDELKTKLDNVKYTLPKDVVFNNKKYSKKDMAAKVIYFLNKLEVKWEHTLGLFELVNLWKSDDFNEIPYAVYDSTLRTLNQVSFKGMSEWTDILAVNEYFSPCHNEYSLDTGILLYHSERHNRLMNRMKELDPNSNVPEEMK